MKRNWMMAGAAAALLVAWSGPADPADKPEPDTPVEGTDGETTAGDVTLEAGDDFQARLQTALRALALAGAAPPLSPQGHERSSATALWKCYASSSASAAGRPGRRAPEPEPRAPAPVAPDAYHALAQRRIVEGARAVDQIDVSCRSVHRELLGFKVIL